MIDGFEDDHSIVKDEEIIDYSQIEIDKANEFT
jgi:hypothetical protein